jgi:hypothetical protein
MSDYGNAPGQGPLRLGGVPAPQGTSEEEKNLPSTMSKSAKAQAESLQMMRDLEGGPARVKACGPAYLPQAPGEKPQEYKIRLQRSVFHNYFGRTAKGLVGFIFRKPPELGEDVPKRIVDHWENIDNAGTHGEVFARELEQDAMVAGHNAILVEFPATDGMQKHDAELFGEIRPYWVPIKKDNLVSWRIAVEQGQTILTQVVIRECTMVPDGRFGEKEQTRYRELYRNQGVVGWDLWEISKDKKLVHIEGGTYPTQKEIPLSENVTSGRKSMFESDPPLEDLAHLNLAHYRQWSDQDTSIHKTCVPILAESGVQHDETETTKVVGPSTMFTYSSPDAKAYYVEHSGAALGNVKQSLDDIKTDIASFGLTMMASQKRVAETEESKKIDKSGTDSQLAVSARGLQDCLERALQFHANYLKEEDGGSVEVSTDYDEVLMGADVMTAYANLVGAGFDKEIAIRMLQIGGRIPDDVDPASLALEWDARAQAVEEAKRLEKEEQAEEMMDEARKAA